MVFSFPAGCAKQQQFKAVEQICLPDTDKLQAMKAAEDVLGKMHFAIDKADSEQGLIRTKPLPAALPFEFWRSDNVGSFNSTEANIHSIRRVVELDISRQNAQLCLGCNVKVNRLSLPQRQISSNAQAYQMFTQSSRTMQRLEISPEQKKNMAWVDLGNDVRLATEILKRIEKHVKREE
jgi:hypothetical protein